MVSRPSKIDKTAQTQHAHAAPSKAGSKMKEVAGAIKSLGATSILTMGGRHSLKQEKASKGRSIKHASSLDKIAKIGNMLNFKKK